tara:strand:- start:1215 stop:1544 length:330 start_codon:yes stop_codon:yes gene_type:complete
MKVPEHTPDYINLPEDTLLRYSEADNLWGSDKTYMAVTEEVGELLVAMSHFRRGRVEISDVLEEMADVFIGITHLANCISNIPSLNNRIHRKLRKLNHKLEKVDENESA